MGDVVASLPTFGRIVGSAGTVLSMAAMAQSTLLLPRGDRGTTLESDPTLSVAWTPLSRRAGWNMAVSSGGFFLFLGKWLLFRMYLVPPLFTIAPRVPASTLFSIGGGPKELPRLMCRPRCLVGF